MPEAVIVEALRTPMGRGKPGGALSERHPVDLLGDLLNTVTERLEIEAGEVDDVIAGCVSQAGEQTYNIGRNAVLAAGFPEQVPATTIDRQCGSSQQAVHFAAQGVIAGVYDLVIACGVESMSRVPMGSSMMGFDAFGPNVTERYAPGLIPQGVSAELIAQKWALSRTQLDELSARSHQLAEAATVEGRFEAEIVPVDPGNAGPPVTTDEGIRPGTTVQGLAQLKPAFQSESWAARFPDVDWKITAGNSSQITDGAAAVVVTTPEKAAQLGLRPRARVHTMVVVGDDPVLMLTGPIPATDKALARSGLAIDDIDLFEVNEAFAPVVLAWLAETGADIEKVNVNGGAIALGHPLGASGARLMTTMLHALEGRAGRYALQTMCEGGGLSNATILERLD